jgi:hypothetical protein
MGVMNPSTHNYLGGIIVPIEWNNPIWREYDGKKVKFMNEVREGQFAKRNMEEDAKKCLLDQFAKFAKTKADWLNIIQKVHPQMTTEEMQMCYAMIKMIGRIKEGVTNGEFEGGDGQADPD